MKLLCLFLFLLPITSLTQAQEKPIGVEFHLFGGFGSKSNVLPIDGNYPVSSKYSGNLKIASFFRYPFTEKINLLTGLEITLGSSNIYTNYPVKSINPIYTEDKRLLKNKEGISLISLPVLFEYNLESNRPISYFFQGGLKLNYSLLQGYYGSGHIFSMADTTDISAFEESSRLNNNGKPWITTQLGFGIFWKLKNSGPIRTGLIADISFSKVVQGTYSVSIPGQPDTYGQYNNHLSSLGIVIGYGLNSRKKQPVSTQAKSEAVNLQSQVNDHHRNKSGPFGKTNFSIGFSALYNFPAKVITNKGENLLGANAMPGVGISAGFFIPLNQNYSIITGLNASMIGRNFSLSLDKERFTPNLQESIKLKGRKTLVNDFMIGIPIGLERRIIVRPDAYFSIDAGYKLNYYTGADIEIQEVFGKPSEDTAISIAIIETENESKLIGNAFLNVGYNKILKNKNTVRIAIESNLAFSHHQTGDFSIYIADDTISTGTYSARGSYIGLGFTYIYSRPKRKVIYNRR